jgi:hypothetical protein
MIQAEPWELGDETARVHQVVWRSGRRVADYCVRAAIHRDAEGRRAYEHC